MIPHPIVYVLTAIIVCAIVVIVIETPAD